jgi:hypothetical protein
MACKPGCNCFICQSKKIKQRNKKNALNKIAQEFETKSGGIITKSDIINLGNDYTKK